jgi:hypothetical protein
MDAGLSPPYGWTLAGPQQDTSLREKGKEQRRYRKRGEKVLSQIFSERFSLHVEMQCIFYRVTFAPKKRESLYF